MLARLGPAEQRRLIDAMRTIETMLGGAPESKASYVLRPHQPGDMGWVVHRHGALYAQEYGFDERFESLVAAVVAKFVERYDPRRERCWIAEKDGEIVGSVFLVRRSRSVAQLRLLLVEPKARGLGIGERLVAECVRFAPGGLPDDHVVDQQRGCAPPGASIRRPGSGGSATRSTEASGASSWARRGSSRCDEPVRAAAAAATGIQVGAAMVATRLVVDQAGPASLALLRYCIGVCCLLPAVVLSRSRVRFAPATWCRSRCSGSPSSAS